MKTCRECARPVHNWDQGTCQGCRHLAEAKALKRCKDCSEPGYGHLTYGLCKRCLALANADADATQRMAEALLDGGEND